MTVRPRPRWTAEEVLDLAARDVRTTVEIAGEILGMGRSAAYDAVRRDAFPVPVIKISQRRWVVPTAALLRVLELGEEVNR